MIRLKSLLVSSLLVFGSTFVSAQSSAVSPAVTLPKSFTFQTVNFSGDPFTQLLGINNAGVIAGYHGVGTTANPNQGFTLTLPGTFTTENFPASLQTQVVGINKNGDTVGFFIDAHNVTHGFVHVGTVYRAFDFPGTTFNQLLGYNDLNEAAGYSQDKAGNQHPYVWLRAGNVYESILMPVAVSAQATGINDLGNIVGFYVDRAGVNHGFLIISGKVVAFNYPGSTLTQCLGININNEVVGTYNDATGGTHGFVWLNGVFQTVDDPNGVGMTVANGINDSGVVVGFYGNVGGGVSNGFVATPQ